MTIQNLVQKLIKVRDNSPSLQENTAFLSAVEEANAQLVSKFAASLVPTRASTDLGGSGEDFERLLSFLRERESENEILRSKVVEAEKKTMESKFSGVDAGRNVAELKAENTKLSQEIEKIRKSHLSTER